MEYKSKFKAEEIDEILSIARVPIFPIEWLMQGVSQENRPAFNSWIEEFAETSKISGSSKVFIEMPSGRQIVELGIAENYVDNTITYSLSYPIVVEKNGILSANRILLIGPKGDGALTLSPEFNQYTLTPA